MNIRVVSLLSAIACSIFVADAQNLYKFRDASIPDITVPQAQAQVVTPLVFAQLGSQDRALQNIDIEIAEIKKDVGSIKGDIKPLQETDIRVRFILSILGWCLGIVLTSGLGGWFFHKLQERSKRKIKPSQTGAVGL
jgi:hypothetical protein